MGENHELYPRKTKATYIRRSHHTTDLFHGIQIRAKSPMHGEYFLVDDCCNRQAIEAIGECLPQLDVISPLALVVESVYAVDRCALVVSTQNKEIFWILDLVREKQTYGFERLFASVDIIPKEKVICFRWKASVFKEAEEIVILTMYIATDLQWVK